MNINYIRDNGLVYEQDVLKGLMAYNKTFTGETPSETVNVYVLDGDKVVGGCHTELGWNWVFIEDLFYQNEDVLIAMMNELYKRYEGKTEGITFESYIDDRIEDLKRTGFVVLGVLKDKPIGFETHVMVNKKMIDRPVNYTYKLEVMKEKHEEYAKIVVEAVKAYNETLKIDETKMDIQYVAFDQDKVIGGVYGYLIQDYLYISRLWVDAAYRGNDIATKLMDQIEGEAKEQGYKNAYLGTCTFQAKDFYEKRGYEVNMIISNCPKGFDDFMMVKEI